MAWIAPIGKPVPFVYFWWNLGVGWRGVLISRGRCAESLFAVKRRFLIFTQWSWLFCKYCEEQMKRQVWWTHFVSPSATQRTYTWRLSSVTRNYIYVYSDSSLRIMYWYCQLIIEVACVFCTFTHLNWSTYNSYISYGTKFRFWKISKLQKITTLVFWTWNQKRSTWLNKRILTRWHIYEYTVIFLQSSNYEKFSSMLKHWYAFCQLTHTCPLNNPSPSPTFPLHIRHSPSPPRGPKPPSSTSNKLPANDDLYPRTVLFLIPTPTRHPCSIKLPITQGRRGCGLGGKGEDSESTCRCTSSAGCGTRCDGAAGRDSGARRWGEKVDGRFEEVEG